MSKKVRYCVSEFIIAMTIKKLIFIITITISIGITAQNKVFTYNQIQSRDDNQEWSIAKIVCEESVRFTANEINLNVDKNYHLNIISKTDLPDKGIIYLCKDQEANPVTVMLIDNYKMYFYSKSKRYLINFNDSKASNLIAESD